MSVISADMIHYCVSLAAVLKLAFDMLGLMGNSTCGVLNGALDPTTVSLKLALHPGLSNILTSINIILLQVIQDDLFWPGKRFVSVSETVSPFRKLCNTGGGFKWRMNNVGFHV